MSRHSLFMSSAQGSIGSYPSQHSDTDVSIEEEKTMKVEVEKEAALEKLRKAEVCEKRD